MFQSRNQNVILRRLHYSYYTYVIIQTTFYKNNRYHIIQLHVY